MERNKIYQGDALEVLKTFPNESINCVMTSPPYWALRDYGVENQLGLEQTFQEYINKLCDIFDEVKRVLRKDGTCWVNLGDTYGTKSGSGFANDNLNPLTPEEIAEGTGIYKANELRGTSPEMHKNLCNIPSRFSIEMQNRGWILRNVIIWHKPNCMPCSVKDRFTVDFEYIFFFVKSKRYWFEMQYEPLAESSFNDKRKDKGLVSHKKGKSVESQYAINGTCINSLGRNKRTVWTITTKPFSESHFAVYPEELCETPIKSGCPEFVCNKCGKAREKIIEKPEIKEVHRNKRDGDGDRAIGGQYQKFREENPDKFLGLTDCNCNAGFSGGVVLDMFFGAGTTGLVALKLNRQFIGIELKQEYIDIAKKRLKPYLEQTKLQ